MMAHQTECSACSTLYLCLPQQCCSSPLCGCCLSLSLPPLALSPGPVSVCLLEWRRGWQEVSGSGWSLGQCSCRHHLYMCAWREVHTEQSVKNQPQDQDCTTAHPNSPGVNISCSLVNSSPVRGRCVAVLWRHCLITTTREWFSDNSCSAFSTNSSRLFTSDRARSSPVESGYVEGRRGRTGAWVMVKSAKCPNENTSRLGSYFALPPCASGGMYSRVPGRLVKVSGLASGSRSMIRELPKSAIFAVNSESSSTFFAVRSRWMMAGVWL